MWQDKLKSQGLCQGSEGEKRNTIYQAKSKQGQRRILGARNIEVNKKNVLFKIAFIFTPLRRCCDDLPLHSAETLSRLRLNLEATAQAVQTLQVTISIWNNLVLIYF